MGQSGTAVINAVSKSGTDAFHGNGYFYVRDSKFNARDFFTKTKQPFRNEQYGGTFGGPVAEAKTHFFFNYERQREPKTVSSNAGFRRRSTRRSTAPTRATCCSRAWIMRSRPTTG